MAKKRSSSNSSNNSNKNSDPNSDAKSKQSDSGNDAADALPGSSAESAAESIAQSGVGSEVEPGVPASVDADAQAELAQRYGPGADTQLDAAAGELTQEPEGQTPASATQEPMQDSTETEQDKLEPQEALEPEPDEQPAPGAPKPVAKVKTGRAVAWFSLLLALASLGGAGYMYYTLIYQQPMQQLSQQMTSKVDQALATVRGGESASDDKFAELRRSLAELRAQQNRELESLATQQAEQLASTEAGLMTSLNKVANAAPPSEAQWKLAELEYLLRIANHRVLMEADANGALQVLSTADAILRELDDFGLHGVRAQLSDEILALKQVRGADIQGLFLRLEALKRQLSELPLRVPEFNAASNQTGAEAVAEAGLEASPTAAEPGVLAAMQAKISEYVQFRRLRTPVKPLLGPDETMYLELNLRMMLERAQLAALRQQQEVYSQSLSSAQEWLEQYLDPESADVAALVGEIDGLLEVDLVRELPDISGSLRTLLATQRGSS